MNACMHARTLKYAHILRAPLKCLDTTITALRSIDSTSLLAISSPDQPPSNLKDLFRIEIRGCCICSSCRLLDHLSWTAKRLEWHVRRLLGHRRWFWPNIPGSAGHQSSFSLRHPIFAKCLVISVENERKVDLSCFIDGDRRRNNVKLPKSR